LKRFVYDEVDSTMDEAKRLIHSNVVKENTFIIANHQTSGRGTHGRGWVSPKGAGIYLSIIHLPKSGEYFKATSLYTLACGAACIEAIKEACGVQASLKPVNDIYVGDKKLGGILVESILHKTGISSLVTGIGINTHNVFRELDRPTIVPVSLEELISKEKFKQFSKDTLIELIVNKVCSWYEVVMS